MKRATSAKTAAVIYAKEFRAFCEEAGKGYDMEEATALKEEINKYCLDQGADIVGFAPVERWDEMNEVPPDFRPRGLWEPARTVIVAGISMPLPIVETTPSYLHKETYDAANRFLDGLAFNLVRYLNRKGHPAFFFTRDGFASLRLLKERPKAPFSHVMAAKYAGLGTVGLNHCLLTPEFGPRVRFVSVFTSTVLPPDRMIEKDLCIKCGACVKCCPAHALAEVPGEIIGSYDLNACIDYHIKLNDYRTPPCGICTKVCPIGKDRLLYKQPGIMKKYLNEAEALEKDPADPVYKTWTQVRKYGAWNKDYPKDGIKEK